MSKMRNIDDDPTMESIPLLTDSETEGNGTNYGTNGGENKAEETDRIVTGEVNGCCIIL